jgi:hypothetical protein
MPFLVSFGRLQPIQPVLVDFSRLKKPKSAKFDQDLLPSSPGFPNQYLKA